MLTYTRFIKPLCLIKKDAISMLTIGRTIPSPRIEDTKLSELRKCVTNGDLIKIKKMLKTAGIPKPKRKVKKPISMWCLVDRTLRASMKIFLT